MQALSDFTNAINRVLSFSLFQLGATDITVGTVLYVIFLFLALIFLAQRVARWIARSLQVMGVGVGSRQAIASIARYTLIAIGMVIIVQAVGIDLSALTVLAGAAGVGIGFGLQNIINNFVSGLVILFERPIKVGDRVDVGSIHGDVVTISARSTTIVTNDNIAIIVPNSEFISSKVTNWSYTDRSVRFDVPVGVSYGSDPAQVTKLLLEVARGHEGVLSTPAAVVLFEEFGDSSLNFTLQVWTSEYATKPRVLRSELNYAIDKIFRHHEIEIPFPQRDLHVRSGSLDVRTVAAGAAGAAR